MPLQYTSGWMDSWKIKLVTKALKRVLRRVFLYTSQFIWTMVSMQHYFAIYPVTITVWLCEVQTMHKQGIHYISVCTVSTMHGKRFKLKTKKTDMKVWKWIVRLMVPFLSFWCQSNRSGLLPLHRCNYV